MENGNHAGTDYLKHIGEQQEELIDVYPPSGYKFVFAKPSKYAMLFRAGQLPQSAASEAVEAWRAKGLIPEGMEVDDLEAKQVQLAQTALEMRDKVLELSRVPKLVVGEARNPGELSTDKVKDEDLDYLFRWVAAGGDESLVLSKFPGRPGQHSLASANRKKHRTAAK